MDNELFVALLALWLTTTTAMVSFLYMWFCNNGEAFHPHSVDIDQRHKLFLVVSSSTECKLEFAIKSISSFAAPRGSSSSAYFTAITVMTAVSGALGTSRWYFVGDAEPLEAFLAFFGFLSLFLVAAFEMDVAQERFLEDKLLVTGWLIKRLGLQTCFPFKISPYSEEFKEFIRESEIYNLYEEDLYIQKKPEINLYQNVYTHLHIIGAIGYTVLTTASILVNDASEEKVAWITGFCFTLFGFIGYLTGRSYLPVFPIFQCWILVWNPFIREPEFMLKLINAIKLYHHKHNTQNKAKIDSNRINTISKRKNKKNIDRVFSNPKIDKVLNIKTIEEADKVLNSIPLSYARNHPRSYIKYIGIILVMSELIALMTPAVGMGIQWVTALCDGPPVLVIIELVKLCYRCIIFGDCKFLSDDELHCILK